jgi:voltage-gated potassium channel
MGRSKLRSKLYQIIFEADTPEGKAFDIVLLIAIVLSVVVVLLDSVVSLDKQYGKLFNTIEWILTFLFTLEYVLRIYSARKPTKYIVSFYGVIDLLAILPSYLSLVLVGSHYLVVIRILRLLRVFRVLKLARFIGAANNLRAALRSSRAKIIVFMEVVLTIVVIIGSVMYLIEGPEHGFTNIPRSIYWAIVTITTVGYGDIAPQTPFGQILASLLMITGYAIIAVPTGIISHEMSKVSKQNKETIECPRCGNVDNDENARYCKVCGERLSPEEA